MVPWVVGSNPTCRPKSYKAIEISGLRKVTADFCVKIGTETEQNKFWDFQIADRLIYDDDFEMYPRTHHPFQHLGQSRVTVEVGTEVKE